MSTTAVLSVLFAVLAAVSNAMGTVLQRRAALIVPQSDSFRLRLMLDLLRTPVWFGGILGVIFAAVFQALALATGPLAVVQPIFVLELPFALLISGVVFGKRMPRWGWLSVAAIVVGLGTALFAASPRGGDLQPSMALWVLAVASCCGAMVVLSAAARRRPVGSARAVCLGTAAAIGYALTAALMKSATDTLDHQGVAAFFESWQTYGFAVVGVCALFLLENAMQAGPLVASQPALTLGDALISLSLGVTLYNESVRTGWWLVPQIFGAGLVLLGAVGLSRLDAVRRAGGTAGDPGTPPPEPQPGEAHSAEPPPPNPPNPPAAPGAPGVSEEVSGPW
ncbi:DMT family transporter [Streptacidiphilus sp. P02-A3a]|uniref:DMT family transporter n=1 Tax=Streptacidiphilus sp. P02-A3a TaxID=2704468 RepID=UPI001CDD6F5B|nr:DMT family transporter [Streptacidiphilus sp. P02-A3a]